MAIPNVVDPPTTQMKRASALRYLLIGVGYILIFLALDKATHVLDTSPGISPWYPPPGLSLALLLTCGLAYLPLLFLATLFVALLSDCCRTAPLFWLGVPFLIMLGYGCAALILRRIWAIDSRLSRLQDLLRLIIVVLLSSLSVGLCIVAIFAGSGLIPWPAYASAVLEFWVGDAIGISILTPFLLVHFAPHLKHWLTPSIYPEPLTIMPDTRARPFGRWSTPQVWSAWAWGLLRCLCFGLPLVFAKPMSGICSTSVFCR